MYKACAVHFFRTTHTHNGHETPLYCRCKECVARFGSNTVLCALHRGGVDKGKSRGTSTEAPAQARGKSEVLC